MGPGSQAGQRSTEGDRGYGGKRKQEKSDRQPAVTHPAPAARHALQLSLHIPHSAVAADLHTHCTAAAGCISSPSPAHNPD